VSSGAVTMKITSSTSITSISGTMLISAIGWDEARAVEEAKAIASVSSGRHGRERHVARLAAGAAAAAHWPIDRKVSSSKAKASSRPSARG
jgi:hypothetical protein